MLKFGLFLGQTFHPQEVRHNRQETAKTKEREMKKIIAATAALLIIAIFSGCNNNERTLVKWDIYEGVIDQFTVKIEDSLHNDSNGQVERIIHLYPTANNNIFPDEIATYAAITGHDYDGDGFWDRVFYCGYPESINGCNSVTLEYNHNIKSWEPCPADEHKVQQFTPDEVNLAVRYISMAMLEVHNYEHLTSTLERWRALDALGR